MQIGDFLSKLGRFKWTLHNTVAHPLSELLYLVGLKDFGNWVHDITIPRRKPNTKKDSKK